jgi:hypothetical protein
MSIAEIEDAIKELPPDKVKELMEWFVSYHSEIWDKQIAEDLDGGRFNSILEEVDSEIDSGIGRPL